MAATQHFKMSVFFARLGNSLVIQSDQLYAFSCEGFKPSRKPHDGRRPHNRLMTIVNPSHMAFESPCDPIRIPSAWTVAVLRTMRSLQSNMLLWRNDCCRWASSDEEPIYRQLMTMQIFGGSKPFPFADSWNALQYTHMNSKIHIAILI